MTSASLTELQRETLALFESGGEPRTTTEIADLLDIGRRSTYDRLQRLVDHDRLETKKVGGNGRVWWRPSVNAGETPDWSAAAESLIDDVLERADVGIFVLDEDFEVAWINDATERYFGLVRNRVLGMDKRQLIETEIAAVVDDESAFAETVLATYDDNTYTERFECRVRPEDDRARWLEHRSKPIETGAFAGGRVELYYDVTHQRESRRMLTETKRGFRSLVDAVEEYAIFMLDSDGYVQTWNEGAAQIKGYATEEIVGEHFATFYTDEAREAGVPEEILAAAAEHGSVEDEGWRLRADGSRFWANVTVTAIRGDDGGIDGYAKVTRDMTERRENERKRKRERNFLEQVQEVSPIGIAIFDTDGDLYRANQRFMELLGKGDPESFDYSLGDRPPLDADGNVIPYPERPAPRALSTGEPVIDQRMRIDGPDGRTRWLSVNAKPFEDETAGVVVTTADVTQLKRQAERLERQRDELRGELGEVFERIDDGFFAIDEKWRISYLNDRFEEIIGKTAEELLERNVWDAFPDALDRSYRERYERAMETQEPVTFEEFSDAADGWLEVTAYPSETGLSVYFRDVTERKERERELEGARKRYRTLLRAAPDPVFVADAETGTIVEVNAKAEELRGQPEDEIVGNHQTDLHPSDEVDAYRENFEDHVEEGGTRSRLADGSQLYIVTGNGERVPVEISVETIELAERTVIYGIFRDVSERLESQRRLEESERRYRTLVDNFPNGAVALFDENLRYLTVGGELFDGFDCSVDDLEGALLSEHVPEELFESLEPKHRAVFDGEASEFEREYAGEIRRFYLRPVSDESGTVVAGMAMSQDVTQRREYEHQLEQQREQLTALDNINETVREVTNAVIEQSTREEIEQVVCDHLTDSESYLFAWTGDVDAASQTVNTRTEAGVDGYLDGITISVDPDDERSKGPTGRALRTGEPQVTHDIQADARHDPWRGHIEQYDFRSSAAIPIVHEGTVYGVINIYADRPFAFDGQERDVISQLGVVVGHAIAAAERKQALMSDELVELEFQIQDVFAALDIPEESDGQITLDHAVPVDEGEFLVYGTATPEAVDTVTKVAEHLSHWKDLTVRSEGDPTTFEARLADPPVLSVVASLGGYVERAVFSDGDYRMTIHLAPSIDARRVKNAVEAAYPDVEMLRRRQISRDRDDPKRFQRHLVEDLTDRQQTVLEMAYHAGFFEWPRDTTGEEIAESLGVASPTFYQHLRKGERKVFDAVFSSPLQKIRGESLALQGRG